MPGDEIADRRRGTAVDDPGGQVPQEIDDQRPGEAIEQLCQLRADARQQRDRCEQSIEDGGTHPNSLYLRDGTAKSAE